MFEDMPKRPSRAGIYIGLLLIVAVIVAIYYILFGFAKKPSDNILSVKNSPSNILDKSPSTPSPKINLTPGLTPTPTPTQKNTPDIYNVPSGEKYVISSMADTNGDGRKETLVITKKQDSKYRAYVLSDKGKKLYDNADLLQKPSQIELQNYSTSEKYKSWMLIFGENSGNLAFIHWNGNEYEIPASLGI